MRDRWPIEFLLHDFYYHHPLSDTLILSNELKGMRYRQGGDFRNARRMQHIKKQLKGLGQKDKSDTPKS